MTLKTQKSWNIELIKLFHGPELLYFSKLPAYLWIKQIKFLILSIGVLKQLSTKL